MRLHVLIVEDEDLALKHLAHACERAGYSVATATTAADGLCAARDREPDIVLLDLNLPDRHGLEILPEIKRMHPRCEVVVNTGISDVEVAVEAMRQGAFDYIVKPLNLDAILLTFQRVADTRQLKRENRFLREQYESQYSIKHVGIHGPKLAAVFEEATRFAPRELPVLIQGESGTGKELVARHLHARSAGDKTPGPFVPINCSAMPAGLVESELFGYAPGAFTGAERGGREGKFAAADGGSIFLDEIGEFPLEMQAKLLRVLESKAFYPVGGSREAAVDVKVICATNRDLADEVAAGRFRKDLFFRINVGQLTIPPLRERRREVLPLAEQFFDEFATSYARPSIAIDPSAAVALEAYPWPGNVRELRNLCERIVLVETERTLTGAALARLGIASGESNDAPDAEAGGAVASAAPSAPFSLTDIGPEVLPSAGMDLEGHIDAVVRAAYEKNRENQSKTARYLGVTREVLRHRLKKMGLIGP